MDAKTEQLGEDGARAWAEKNGLSLEPSQTLHPIMIKLFAWFCDLNRGLGQGMMGPATLTWEGLDRWCARRKCEPIDFETDCLFDLSNIYYTVMTANVPDATDA